MPRLLAVLGLGLTVAACVARGPVDNPVGRALTWFSYVGGDDIREACQPGAPDRWRFVYNGRYEEQVRSYDLVRDALGPGAVLQSRVYPPSSLASVDLRNPSSPWMGQFDQRFLQPDQIAAIDRAAAPEANPPPMPPGDFLRSDAYYWTASVCRDGRFRFAAWQEPGRDLSRLAFVEPLLTLDRTGVAYNEPRRLTLPPFESLNGKEPEEVAFRLQVGENGLRIGPRLR